MLQKIRWFLLLTGIVLVLIVAFQNSRRVELDLLFFRGEYPLTLLLLACSAASFLFGALTTAWMLRSRRDKSGPKPVTKKKAVTSDG